MPLKPSHNLLVRGSNPCGRTTYIADFRVPNADFRLLIAEFSAGEFPLNLSKLTMTQNAMVCVCE
jgi:hypothetical protein